MKNEGINIVFVCLGNICRSPAAEGIMKKMIEDEGLENKVFVDSAGTSNWNEGNAPDDRMRKHGLKRGYDFTGEARVFKSSDFDKFDYILVMDNNNYNNVKKLAKSEEEVAKIHRMTDFAKDLSNDHVPDPYYGGEDGFELVMDLLEDATKGLLEEIKSKL
ncbi:MAG TPA: low molecular weight protein-tyrosine-phosphatase [Dysgonamonadaceae bacterium]|nr:low molecular weight protein-tyrosine-phosphatase [Dysgonamonadaceae bacterium]